jgi:heptosyltransferase-2
LVHDQGQLKPVIQRDLDGAWTFFGKSLNTDVPNYKDYSPHWHLKAPVPKKPQIVFGVVASRAEKMYPIDYFADLSRIIKKEYSHVEIVAPISNSAEDARIETEIYATGASIRVVKKKLSELPAFFAQSQIYIGNDTGLKHIAVASGLPTVTLFGPELPYEWHPYDTDKHPYLFIKEATPKHVWGKAAPLFSGF